MTIAKNYGWDGIGAQQQCSTSYVLPAMDALVPSLRAGARVLDLGCGNGAMSKLLAARGCEVVGIEPSADGIRVAMREARGVRFVQEEATPGLLERLGMAPFEVVVSTEVVEHVYDVNAWAAACFNCLCPGGRLVCSTPYHGYLKNIGLCALNRWDRHHQTNRTGGHIKFFSPRTLSQALASIGFQRIQWRGAGRLPLLWKSFVMSGVR